MEGGKYRRVLRCIVTNTVHMKDQEREGGIIFLEKKLECKACASLIQGKAVNGISFFLCHDLVLKQMRP